MTLLDNFKKHLDAESSRTQSENTVKSYVGHIKQYLAWFVETYGIECSRLYRPNVLEYLSYMKNVRKLQPSSINAKLSALSSLNKYLMSVKIQDDQAIHPEDYIPFQKGYINPCKIRVEDVEHFRQRVLEGEGARDYAIVTTLAYTGARISELLDIDKDRDVNLQTGELIIASGKGRKRRVVFMNDKVVSAIREYLKIRKGDDLHLFVSGRPNKKDGSYRLDRTSVNRLIAKHSDVITPHELRHFFGTWAQEVCGFTTFETAYLMGHSSTRVTEVYTNPDVRKMREKINK